MKIASQSWLHIIRSGQKLFIEPSICSRPLLITSPGILSCAPDLHAPQSVELRGGGHLVGSQLLGSLALLGVLLGHLFDDPIAKCVSSALMQVVGEYSLLLENGASSDAGNEDDGTGEHARGGGGGLGGRHVCVLFLLGWSVCGTVMRLDSVPAYRRRVGEKLVDEMWMVWLRDGFRR
jgi:hypothetical protein